MADDPTAAEKASPIDPLLSCALESITDGLLLLDRQWRCTYVSEAAARLWQLSREQLLGNVVWEVLPPEAARAKLYTEFHRAVHENSSVHFEAPSPPPAAGWFEYHGYPSPEGLTVYFRDINERKQQEETLLRAKQQWEHTFDSVPDLIAILDTQYRIVRVNRAMAERLGRAPRECIGVSCFAAVHGLSEPPPFCPNVWTLADRQEHCLEVHEEHLGGDFVITTSPLLDDRGQLLGSVHVAHDITKRKQAETALRQREEEYESLVEACPHAVVMTDLHGQILFASQRTWTWLGLADGESPVGRSVFDFVAPHDRERLATNLLHVVEAGMRTDTEYTVIRPDGATMPTEVSSAVIRDAAGAPKAAMAVIRDISERKRAEQRLEKERRTLEHMLRASDHERQLVAYDIHDGLAQQLAGALMQLQIYEYAKDADPEQARKAYEGGVTLLRQAHLEARRLISGLRPPILDESGVVAAIAHLVDEQRSKQGPKIEFLSKVRFTRLETVLENAVYRIVQEGLANAVRHSQSELVQIGLVQRADRLRVEIRDWGIGFDPKKVPANRFGLSGIRQRARLLGGKCRIQSKPGEGATILVYLPLVERAPPERSSA